MTSSEDFDDILKGVRDGIIYNIVSLVQSSKYFAIDTEDPTSFVYYVVKYVTDAFTLHKNITNDGRLSKSGQMSV